MSALAAVPRETFEARLEEIPLELIDIGANVRVDAGDLAELAASIAELGVLEPVKVTAQPDGRYRLVWGQRRVLAAKLAERTTILAIVEPPAADVDEAGARRSIEQLAENLQRQDLNPIEEAVALREVLEGTQGLTQEALAKRLGVSAPWVSNALALLDTPPAVQEHVRAGRLTPSHVKAMRGQAPKIQLELATAAVDRGWSAHGLEDEVQRRKRSAEWDQQHAAQSKARDAGRVKSLLAGLEKRKVPKDARIHVVSWGGYGHIAAAIRKAGYTGVVTERSGVSARSNALGCDCTAWMIEIGFGPGTPRPACIVAAHREAKAAADEAKRQAQYQVQSDGRKELRRYLEAELVDVPASRVWARVLLWQLLGWNKRDWAAKRRPDEKNPDPWAVISSLTDAEIRAEIAERLASHLSDSDVAVPWDRLLAELRGDVDAEPTPAAPSFSPAALAAARAELGLDGDD